MTKFSSYRVLAAGILAIPATAFLGLFTYSSLTRASVNRDQDFVFRITTVIFAMAVPFLLTLLLLLRDRRQGALRWPAKIGLALAVLSLGLTWVPARGLIGRARRNLAAARVQAPLFDTIDIQGKQQRLRDHVGKVIVINAWATWCGPCKREMPELEHLYRKHKDDGLMIFGISTEDVELQRKFVLEQVPVTYPLLTAAGDVPGVYKDVERWPSIFLIDRKGHLRPAPAAGQSFDKIEAAVDLLMKEAGN